MSLRRRTPVVGIGVDRRVDGTSCAERREHLSGTSILVAVTDGPIKARGRPGVQPVSNQISCVPPGRYHLEGSGVRVPIFLRIDTGPESLPAKSVFFRNRLVRGVEKVDNELNISLILSGAEAKTSHVEEGEEEA